jgi:hypothetical protein
MAAIPLTLQDVSTDIQLVQIPKWIKAVEDIVMRKTFLFRRIKQGGRVENEPGGYEMIWNMKVRLPEVEGFDNHQGISFSPISKEIQFRSGFRNFRASDAMSWLDGVINQGPTAFRRLVNDKAKDLRAAMERDMEAGVYRDGDLPVNILKPHGIESGLGAGTCTSADKIAAPSDTYANQSTVLATNGGFWSADLGTPNNASLANDWPDGNGDTDYDCTSPKLINTNTLAWGLGTTNHADNLYRAISQGLTWMAVTSDDKGTPDLCPTDSHSFQRMRETQEAKMRLTMPVASGVDLGMPGSAGSLNLDGLTIYPDFWCPVQTSYLLRSDQVSIVNRLGGGNLFESHGPVEIPHMMFAKVWAILASCNLKFRSMRYFGKIHPFAA